MKLLVILVFLIAITVAKAQSVVDWDINYQLQFVDFRSPTTQIGKGSVYSLRTGATMGFSFHMSNAEFMFTKNFNSKVNCSFNRDAASIIAPDSLTALHLLSFARYEFDLSELYARKFRKKLYEEKGTLSDAGFFKPIYNQIQQEFNERGTIATGQTDTGRNVDRLKELHQEVLAEIELLADYCKLCKPSKKKKSSTH